MTTGRDARRSRVGERNIHAYVDGLLDGTRRSSVEAYLAANPEEAARVEVYRSQNIGLHVLFDNATLEPLPHTQTVLLEHLTEVLGRPKRKRTFAFLGGSSAAIAAAILVGWLTIDTFGGPRSPGEDLVAATSTASSLGEDPFLPPFDRISGARASETFSLLARHYSDAPSMAPNLEPDGFKLVVQRVFPTPRGPALQLLYQSKAGDWITLYIGGDQRSQKTKFSFISREGVSMAYWRHGTLGYGLSGGGLSRDQLTALARRVTDQLGRESLPVAPKPSIRNAAAPVPAETPPVKLVPLKNAVPIETRPPAPPVSAPPKNDGRSEEVTKKPANT